MNQFYKIVARNLGKTESEVSEAFYNTIVEIESKKTKIVSRKCCAVIRSGPKQNQQCGIEASKDSEENNPLCTKHLKQAQKKPKNTVLNLISVGRNIETVRINNFLVIKGTRFIIDEDDKRICRGWLDDEQNVVVLTDDQLNTLKTNYERIEYSTTDEEIVDSL